MGLKRVKSNDCNMASCRQCCAVSWYVFVLQNIFIFIINRNTIQLKNNFTKFKQHAYPDNITHKFITRYNSFISKKL